MIIPRLSLLAAAAFVARAAADCNPLTQNSCGAIPGLATSTYSVDFTKQTSLPSDWVLADAASVTFGSKGAQFNFDKRKDAPYIWTNFYVAYGRIDVELQVASGTGIITSAVMFSDSADEIDWEFSGSNFALGASTGKAQTNVFGKGMTGNYDRGTLQDVSPPPQQSFHTYTIDWTPDKIDWIIDGVTKYSTTNNGQTTGNYQFPQTPSRLHLGMWDAGDPDTAAGTRTWAGGYTDYSKAPYTAYVKSVKISTPYPCKSWLYPTGFSGSWKDVKCVNETVSASSSASTTSSTVKSTYTTSAYVVMAKDNGWGIADKLGITFDQLSAANPGVKWDFLDVGQTLVNPNFKSTMTSASSDTSAASSSPTSNSRSTGSGKTDSTSTSNPSNSPSTSSGTSATNSTKDNTVVVTTAPPNSSASGPTAVSTSTSAGSLSVGKTTTTSGPVPTSNSAQSSSSSSSSSSSGRPTTSVPATSLTCVKDTCLNSMVATRYISSARSFCSNLSRTTAVATPVYLIGCAGKRSRVESACSCLSKNYPVTASASMTVSAPSSSSRTSSSSSSSVKSTTSSSSASTWSNWAGNWAAQKPAGRNWGPWKRNRGQFEQPHGHGNQPGRFGGGRQHA